MSEARKANAPVSGWLVAVLLLLVGALVYRLVLERTTFLGGGPVSRTVTPRGDLADDEQATVDLFHAAAPSVVFVTASELVEDRYRQIQQVDSAGSGIVWDKEGHIVTNFHVVKKAIQTGGTPHVTLSDNSSWDAPVISFSPLHDLAVLKINAPASRLVPLAIGTSNDLQIGQKVFAIGNPFGLDHTLTTGVIGGVGRSVPSSLTGEKIEDMIQTDAAINPGNSGGPLLDSAGRMIGVNTMIYSPSGAYAGVGFAVPVDTVNVVVPELIDKRYGTRPGLGVGLMPDSTVMRLRDRGLIEQPGALVDYILPGSPIANSGLQPTRRGRLGDLIVSLEGQPIANGAELRAALNKHDIGDSVTLGIVRDGQQQTIRTTLQSYLNQSSQE